MTAVLPAPAAVRRPRVDLRGAAFVVGLVAVLEVVTLVLG